MRFAYAFLVGMLALGLGAGAAAAKSYKVRVDSAPQGATVYVDDKVNAKGITPWDGSLAKGTHTIYLSLAGYEDATKVVKIVRTRKQQQIFMPMTKKAVPPQIEVTADADKNAFGATVYLDDEAQGTIPMTVTTDEGRHQVKIRKDGYQDFTQWVNTKNDGNYSVNPVLTEIEKPKFGSILIDADVADADAYLDGKSVGTTPVSLEDINEGLHVVEVKKDPAVPWKVTVQVEVDKQTKVRAELAATIKAQGGIVKVLSNVTGAHVYLDGKDMGEVPVEIKDVKPGDHIIEVKAPGYQNREEPVTVNAGSSTVLKLDLNKEAKAEAKLTVVSAVPDADVYIDGASVGKVPVTQDVTSGEHNVLVKLDGYKDFNAKVRVEAGQTRSVSADLKAVGKLRVLSDPPGATVLINGMPQDKQTPLELDDIEVGETFVRIEMAGREPQEKKVTITGGKTEIISIKLDEVGMTPEAKLAEQRGLSSFGARTLPRGRSTIDFGIGYPYFGEIRVNVGATKKPSFGFDAGVSVRSFGARSELGLGARFMLVNADPFTAGAFTDIWWGSKLLDNSGRNGFTWNAGGLASLTALTHVTITGRAYFNIWSDRHCPSYDATTMMFAADAEPINACQNYLDRVVAMGKPMADPGTPEERMEKLTGLKGTEMFGRENGLRFMTSIIAEVAYKQNWSIWFMLEGAPFQGERALLTDQFAAPMTTKDYNTYARVGLTYKF